MLRLSFSAFSYLLFVAFSFDPLDPQVLTSLALALMEVTSLAFLRSADEIEQGRRFKGEHDSVELEVDGLDYDFHEALRLSQDAIALCPQSAHAHYVHGQCLEEFDQNMLAAKEEYEVALKLDPQHVRLLFLPSLGRTSTCDHLIRLGLFVTWAPSTSITCQISSLQRRFSIVLSVLSPTTHKLTTTSLTSTSSSTTMWPGPSEGSWTLSTVLAILGSKMCIRTGATCFRLSRTFKSSTSGTSRCRGTPCAWTSSRHV